MELLGARSVGAGRGWRPAVLAALVGVLAAAGCALVERVFAEERRFAFSHDLHVMEEGLDCFSCHETAMMGDDPGMPDPDGCAVCHDDIDQDRPPERQVASLFADGTYRAARAALLDDEVVFSHRAHVTDEQSCADCHDDIETNEVIGPEQGVPMADCMACHAERSAPNECADCHTYIDEDWAPEDHHRNWLAGHGLTARAAMPGVVAEDCTVCHDRAECVDCHQDEAPLDHTNHFRRRGHGLLAMMDRQRCEACHQPDACDRCHAEALPASHTGMFGGVQSLHCLGCHFPLQSEASCSACHQSTPSHLSTPKPPDHHPAMNCRQCHGQSGLASLPHVDKGDDCNQCHP